VPSAFGHLEELAGESLKKQVIEDLPRSENEAQVGDYRFRAQVIGERLWLLGYIGKKKFQAKALYNTDRPAFLEAVRKFQGEALLREDGWAGPKTWATLEELVSFEGLPVTDRWFREPQLPRAFQRSVQCRLHVLGLSRSGPDPEFKELDDEGVAELERVLVSLRLVEPDGATREEVLTLLLSQDRIAEAITRLVVKDPSRRRRSDEYVFRYYKHEDWSSRAHLRLMRKFILQIAKVELWLLGFDIDLDGKDNYPVKFFPAHGGSKSRKVERALRSFYTDLANLGGAQARKFAAEIAPRFFRQIYLQSEMPPDREGIEADPELSDIDYLLERFRSREHIDEALVQGRSLGMRLWDGMRRLYRWFRKLIRRIVEIGQNLVRGFYRYASKGMQILRRSIRAFVESARTYITSEFRDAGADWPLVEFRRDLDVRIYSGADVTREGRIACGERMRLFSSRFRFGAQIIGLIFETLVFGVAVGLGNLLEWARFARSLVGRLRDITPIYREIQAVETSLGVSG
jgi:hypothetical protein